MNTSANISTLSATSITENRAPAFAPCDGGGGFGLNGSARRPSQSVATPSGRLIANNIGQDDTERMAAATEGPATDDAATTSELSASPCPSRARG